MTKTSQGSASTGAGSSAYRAGSTISSTGTYTGSSTGGYSAITGAPASMEQSLQVVSDPSAAHEFRAVLASYFRAHADYQKPQFRAKPDYLERVFSLPEVRPVGGIPAHSSPSRNYSSTLDLGALTKNLYTIGKPSTTVVYGPSSSLSPYGQSRYALPGQKNVYETFL